MVIKKPKGTRDIYGSLCEKYRYIEDVFREICKRYNFREVIIVDTAGISTVYANEGGVVLAF